MLTYSKIKDLPIPPEFLITKENYKDIPNPHPDKKEYSNWEWSLEQTLVNQKPQGTHNFQYIGNKDNAYYLGGGCTGSFASRRYTRPDKQQWFIPAITGLLPQAISKEHQEYLNFLLNPIISPYSWLMTPDNYKVKLNDKGDVQAYFFLNNETRAPYVSGLSILERTFSYSGGQIYFKTWKAEDKEDFSTFIFLTQFIPFNHDQFNGIYWPYPQHPYSTFDMFIGKNNNGMSRGKEGPHIFSGPRFFQQILNHDAYDLILNKPYTKLLNNHLGHTPSNLVWSSPIKNSDAVLTKQFEDEIYNFTLSNMPDKDAYGRTTKKKNAGSVLEKVYTKHPESIDTLARLTPQSNPIVREYHEDMFNGVLEISKKYIPLFRTEKVV